MAQRPDVAGMRSAAAQIRGKSDRIAVVISRLDGQTGSMTYAGPAADRFRASIASERQRLTKVMGILSQMSEALIQGAAAAEADPLSFYGAGGVA